MATTAATATTHSSSTMMASSCVAIATSGTRASNQGILQHANPSSYDSSNPIVMFIIQAGIIIIFSRLLHYPLKRLRQPRVISEIIGGIILGPSVMGHIPGFTNAIFPTASIPNLNLVANIGLVLFLFLVGLEADFRFLMTNWRTALSVGAAGMALPFGCGAAIAWGLYNEFRLDSGLVPISFGTYLLFIAVAMAITAFPVLCRILTELKLLHTPVGIITLSAGVANDVVGWILLALCVALVNASSGLTALWVLLIAVAWTLMLVYAVRPAFLWVLRKSGSIENGPSQGIVALTMLMVLTSAFFTQVIGIHAIFGAFLMGLIIPHDGGFAIKMTEKIEDLVCALFLPLYFAYSGLNTNLGLLNNGITWGYVIAVIAIAFVTKITGGAVAARLTGRVWRESFAIGCLMSCKGLVELIVLNIGLQARILSTRTFTIFVVMALVTTFATTPLVSALYPPWYQTKLEAWKRGEIDWDGNRTFDDDEKTEDGSAASVKGSKTEISKLLVHLRLDTLPGILPLVTLFSRPSTDGAQEHVHPSKRAGSAGFDPPPNQRPLQVQGIRLKELTERSSSVMAVTELEEYSQQDHVLNTFRTFGQCNRLAVRGAALLCPPETYAATLTESASSASADLMLLSWSATGSVSENKILPAESAQQRFDNGNFSQFLTKTLSQKLSCNAAIFVDNGFGARRQTAESRRQSVRNLRDLELHGVGTLTTLPPVDQGHHIFLPFFGTEDDRVALRLVLQMARNPAVTATITLFELPDAINAESPEVVVEDKSVGKTAKATTSALSSPSALGAFYTLRDSLPTALSQRVVFETISLAHTNAAGNSNNANTLNISPAAEVLAKARTEVGQSPKNAGDLIVLGQNVRLNKSLGSGRTGWMESEAGKVLGSLVGEMILSGGDGKGGKCGWGVGGSLVVVKAARGGDGDRYV